MPQRTPLGAGRRLRSRRAGLHSFTGGDGANPFAGLIADRAGNLYGTTAYGGASGNGVVFKLSPGGTETVLHSFAGGSDRAIPVAGLIADSSGNLYGTTNGGGASGSGTVFKLSGTGSSRSRPDCSGNLYGTTGNGRLALTAANDFTRRIHDRMPVLLGHHDLDA